MGDPRPKDLSGAWKMRRETVYTCGYCEENLGVQLGLMQAILSRNIHVLTWKSCSIQCQRTLGARFGIPGCMCDCEIWLQEIMRYEYRRDYTHLVGSCLRIC